MEYGPAVWSSRIVVGSHKTAQRKHCSCSSRATKIQELFSLSSFRVIVGSPRATITKNRGAHISAGSSRSERDTEKTKSQTCFFSLCWKVGICVRERVRCLCVCACVCICVCMCISVFICVCTCRCMYVHVVLICFFSFLIQKSF